LKSQVKRKSRIIAHLLGFLLPGAGHVYTGRKKQGCAIFLIIVGLFAAGIFMKGGVLPTSADFLSFLCAAGRVGSGLPWLIAVLTDLKTGDMLASFGEIGASYTTIAGLLNLLVVLRISDLFPEDE